jgi:hypothetical protein
MEMLVRFSFSMVSVGFWGSGEGIALRLKMFSGSIITGSYNNALQVLASAYGVLYFKMSGPLPKCEYCIQNYGRIYRQGMFMPEFPAHPFCPHLWNVWFPRVESEFAAFWNLTFQAESHGFKSLRSIIIAPSRLRCVVCFQLTVLEVVKFGPFSD